MRTQSTNHPGGEHAIYFVHRPRATHQHSPSHQVTKSPTLAKSPSHQVTHSPSHQVTEEHVLVAIAVCHRRLKSTTHRHSLNSSSPGYTHHSITLARTVLWIHEHCRRATQRRLDVQLDDRLHRIAPSRNSPPYNSTDRIARSRVIETSPKVHGNIAHLSPSPETRTLHRSSTQRTHPATRQSLSVPTRQSHSTHTAATRTSHARSTRHQAHPCANSPTTNLATPFNAQQHGKTLRSNRNTLRHGSPRH